MNHSKKNNERPSIAFEKMDSAESPLRAFLYTTFRKAVNRRIGSGFLDEANSFRHQVKKMYDIETDGLVGLYKHSDKHVEFVFLDVCDSTGPFQMIVYNTIQGSLPKDYQDCPTIWLQQAKTMSVLTLAFCCVTMMESPLVFDDIQQSDFFEQRKFSVCVQMYQKFVSSAFKDLLKRNSDDKQKRQFDDLVAEFIRNKTDYDVALPILRDKNYDQRKKPKLTAANSIADLQNKDFDNDLLIPFQKLYVIGAFQGVTLGKRKRSYNEVVFVTRDIKAKTIRPNAGNSAPTKKIAASLEVINDAEPKSAPAKEIAASLEVIVDVAEPNNKEIAASLEVIVDVAEPNSAAPKEIAGASLEVIGAESNNAPPKENAGASLELADGAQPNSAPPEEIAVGESLEVIVDDAEPRAIVGSDQLGNDLDEQLRLRKALEA